MRHIRSTLLAAGLLLPAAGSLPAQDFGIPAWDTPIFLPPTGGDDLGIYASDPSGGDWAIAGIWRQTGNLNLGVRLGLADGRDDTSVLLGAEFYGPLVRAGRGFPLDVAWLLGVGATLNGGTFLRIPAGVSIGYEIEGEGLVVVPYAVPRVALDVFAVDDESDTEFSFTADLGVDFRIGRSWILRFGAALFDHDALGIGVAYRTGRRVTAR